jgi:hypothetical protein
MPGASVYVRGGRDPNQGVVCLLPAHLFSFDAASQKTVNLCHRILEEFLFRIHQDRREPAPGTDKDNPMTPAPMTNIFSISFMRHLPLDNDKTPRRSLCRDFPLQPSGVSGDRAGICDRIPFAGYPRGSKADPCRTRDATGPLQVLIWAIAFRAASCLSATE